MFKKKLKIKKNLGSLWVEKGFLDLKPKTQFITGKFDIADFIKMRNSSSLKGHFNSKRNQMPESAKMLYKPFILHQSSI